MADTFIDTDAASRIPPLDVVISTSMPSVRDPIVTQTSQPPLKRRRHDPMSGVLIQEQAPPTQPATTTPTATPTVPIQEGPSTIFESRSSSAPGGSSFPSPMHDIASMRLARVSNEKEATGLPHHGKGI